MGLKYVKGNKFKKGKEEKRPKRKAKASKEDKKEDNYDDWQCGGHGDDNEKYDGKWIEVVKGTAQIRL